MKNKFKKIFAVVLTACIMLTACPLGSLNITASATTGTATSGDYTYIYHKGVAIITGIDWSVSGDVVIPSSLGGYPVQTIGASAFYDCVNITSVTIPYDVIEIDYHAFQNSGIQKIFIPSSVSKINEGAFDGCNDLRAVWYGQSEENKNMNLWISESGNDSLLSSEWHYDACDINSNQSAEHYYYSDCDSLCKNCGWIREPLSEHVYTEDCDEYCNLCNEHTYRAGSHVYSGRCDEICNKCNTVRYIYKPNHSYNTQCDEECAVCGYVRVEEEMHLYDGLCDTECNLCKTQRKTTVEHAFKSDCDEECNTCYFVRSALIQHQYENNCDESCNMCGHMRSVGDHVYDNDCDTECNECKFQREITHNYEWIIDKGSDCAENGVKHEECSICHATRNENTVIEATGLHNYDNACDTQCNTCGQIREIVHDFEWIIDKENDCGNGGVKHEECSICHATRNENTVIEATVLHNYDNTCDTQCNTCGQIREIVHDFEWIIDKENDCGNGGVKHEECSICHATRNENTVINATGIHVYDNKCDTVCNVCYHVRTIEHTYNNACDKECNICQYIRDVGEHNYTLNSGFTCSICKYSKKPNAPQLLSVTATNIYWQGYEGFEYIVEGHQNYWQSYNYISGLIPNTEYTIYQRVAQSNTGNVSEISDPLKVKTLIGYTVTYNANGGENAPYSEIRAEGETFALSSQRPTRSGYQFYGWATSKYGSVVYKAGDECTIKSDVTLYAKWRKICEGCHGTGEKYNISSCINCDGDGEDWGFRECKSCLGSGTRFNGSIIVCDTCNGLGSETYRYVCSKCSGVGEIYGYVTCSSCEGKRTFSEFEEAVITEFPKKILIAENGAVLSISGGEIILYYCDGLSETQNIFNSMISGYDKTFAGIQEIVIDYYGKTAICQVEVKFVQKNIPSAPVVSSFTDTTVTLINFEGCEYSKDGKNWQSSNIFNNLSPATAYAFYQRYAETDTYSYGNKSTGTSVTTDKSKQTLVPDVPTVQSFTTSRITLNMVEGCEYSKDGITWYESNVFSGLSCGTEYKFYQRYKETATTYPGANSAALMATTDKGSQTKPSAPTMLKKTHNSVTLTAIDGYKYSRDGVNWQTRNIFTELNPETNYMFYQRKAETTTHYASTSSMALTVKTAEQPQYTPGDIDGVEGVTDADAVYLLYHTFLSDIYPVNQDCDFNGDGEVNDKDAVYLLYYTFLPDLYPIN